MSSRKSSSVFVQIVVLLATMFATVFVFRLIGGTFFERTLTDPDGVVTVTPGWSAKTWLTLIAILFAETLSFGYGILMAGTPASRGKSFPFQFTAIGMIFIYDLAIVLLSLLALTAISIEWLSSLHVISFICLVIGLGAFHIGSGIVEDIEIRDEKERQPANEHRAQVQELVDIATRLKDTQKNVFFDVLSSLQGDVEYATSESLPGSEGIDAEVQNHIHDLKGLLMSLESNGSSGNPSATVSSELVNKVEKLKLLIQRRDKLMISLRN